MTLDETIKHHEERAEELEKRAEEVAMLDAEGVYQLHVGICREYAEEHRQNAEWLKELKKLRREHTCRECKYSSYGFSDHPCSVSLEQQPCEDCISILNRIMEYTYGMLTTEKFGLQHLIKSMMDDLPSVTPKTRWIPVSKKNPDKRGFYLVSTTDCITIMEFVNGWISQNIGLCNFYVKAWMPLPKPYAESEGEE